MNALSRSLLAAVTLAALGGCGTYTSSQLDGYRYYKAPIDTHPVLITKVDGVSTAPITPVQIDPGTHVVSVQTYPNKLDPLGETRTINLDVKPCTHYYIVAVKQNRLARDFDVKVEHEEPVPGCTPPTAR